MTKRLSDFDIGLLLTLDALLKHQNVTHAASRLNITQSALSARLTRLRQLLNDPLFTTAASGRGMIPTPHAPRNFSGLPVTVTGNSARKRKRHLRQRAVVCSSLSASKLMNPSSPLAAASCRI